MEENLIKQRRDRFIWAAVAVLAVTLILLLSGKLAKYEPEIYDGGGSALTYTWKRAEYRLALVGDGGEAGLDETAAEGKTVEFGLSLRVTGKDGSDASVDFAKYLDTAEFEAATNSNSLVKTGESALSAGFSGLPAANGETTEILLRLRMKNGDEIILRWPVSITLAERLELRWDDEGVDIGTTEKLNALIESVADYRSSEICIYLPAVSYGEIRVNGRVSELIGFAGGGTSVANLVSDSGGGHLAVREVAFSGSGTGLVCGGEIALENVSFAGYDVALDIKKGGSASFGGCTFENNYIAFRLNSDRAAQAGTEFKSNRFENNSVAVLLLRAPAGETLRFTDSVFRGNIEDIVNSAGAETDVSGTIFG